MIRFLRFLGRVHVLEAAYTIMSKINLALIFGGRSTEHEISKLSVESVLREIDHSKYEITLIFIDINGKWFQVDDLALTNKKGISLIPTADGANMIDWSNGSILTKLDIAFPVLHGLFGEDGTIQGFFKMVNLAFVGCGVLASSACMDKDMTKRVLRDAGIAVTPYAVATAENKPSYSELAQELSTTLFIKPANLGSSVGIFKVTNEEEYNEKLEEALTYDLKVLIEQFIPGKEIECAVLGNETPKASVPGEVTMNTDFFDFESKYVDKDASGCLIPAEESEEILEEIRRQAIVAFKAMGCEGLSRIDFFVTKDKEILLNEINTIPGFTEISMYPKMWAKTGIPYAELLDLLITFGLDRYQKEKSLKITAQKVD